ncbi:MAG: hypothetical protein Q7K35_02155, partial [bacterium]|nr:hypothetical protein [bacterium]
PSEQLIKDYLDEIYRVLKPDGIAKIHLRTGLGTYKWHWYYGVAVSPEIALIMAKKAGFSVVEQKIEGLKNLWLTLEKK